MVKAANLGKEIVISVANKVGMMANISTILADHGIDIEAVSGYSVDKEARIMVVTNDNLRAMDALVKAGYKNAKQNEVIVLDLENRTGALKTVATQLAKEHISIKWIYGTICPEGCPARLILSTNANEKALVLLTTK